MTLIRYVKLLNLAHIFTIQVIHTSSKTKRIDGSNRAIANSYDNVVRIETSRDYHYVSISIEALKSHLLKTPKEQSLLESSNNILLDTGKSFDFEKNQKEITFKAHHGDLYANYIVLIGGDEQELSIYIPLPTQSCLQSTQGIPTSCSFDTDECGFLYATIIANGSVIDPHFKYPSSYLTCNIDPREAHMFSSQVSNATSSSPECAGMTELECIFYQR